MKRLESRIDGSFPQATSCTNYESCCSHQQHYPEGEPSPFSNFQSALNNTIFGKKVIASNRASQNCDFSEQSVEMHYN